MSDQLCVKRINETFAAHSSQSYIPGHISVADWTRFAYYAQFVQFLFHGVSDYPENAPMDPSVFTHLQQHARGPLFPNLRELEWNAHFSTSIGYILSPTVRSLHLSPPWFLSALGGREYIEQRDDFMTQLPSMLRGLPELDDLELQTLGSAGCWDRFVDDPGPGFAARNLRTLKIEESIDIVLDAALRVLSLAASLRTLVIPLIAASKPGYSPLLREPSVHAFRALRHLHVTGGMQAIAPVVASVQARELETVALYVSSIDMEDDAIIRTMQKTLVVLCSRSGPSLRAVRLRMVPHFSRQPLEASPRMVRTLLEPLLQLRDLQDVTVDAGYMPSTEGVPLPEDVFIAWPRLRTLAMDGTVLRPETLQLALRSCPDLREIGVMHLARDFAGSPVVAEVAADTFRGSSASVTPTAGSAVGGYALQRLAVAKLVGMADPAAEAPRIARFLLALCPRVCLGRITEPRSPSPLGPVGHEMAKIRAGQA